MNLIRAILPSGKHRMMSDFKSLDIAKITPRMYAMSYPSDNFIESMYHNNQDDIAEYLNKNHPRKYLIFNLSGIPYKREKFNNSVIDYFWPDHKAPPLCDIFNIIYQAYNYLGKDKENVICIHCLAGKGRTGTICCCLLLYGKLFRCSQDANNYFSMKRFKKLDRGVQEPSQVRYIQYFDKMLHNQNFKALFLKAYEIKKVFISGIKLGDGESIVYKFETNYYKENEAENYLSKNKGQIVTGDVTINIYRNGSLKAWVFFNTFFIEPQNNRLYYHIKDIDPRFLLKQPDYNLMCIEIVIYPYFPNNQNMNNNFNNMNQNNFNNNLSQNNNFYNMNQNNIFNNMNQNNNFNNMNQNNNFNNMNQNNNFNNMNQFNNFNNNINQNNNFNNMNQNNFNNNMNQNNFNNNNMNQNNNFNQNNFNNNMNQNNFNNNNMNQNNNFNQNNFNNNNMNQNNFNKNNMNLNNNFNQNNFNNNMNQNNNSNNTNNNSNNRLVDDMMNQEMNKIKKMNEYIYYANNKNTSQFYQENKILFFGDENDDTFDVLNQIKNQK